MTSSVAALDWSTIGRSLDAQGFAPLPPLLTCEQCADLAALYIDDARFRSRIEMERVRLGAGKYKYFASPLPPIVQTLRTELYARLAPIANGWIAAGNVRIARLKPRATEESRATNRSYPATLDAFLAICHKAGQKR